MQKTVLLAIAIVGTFTAGYFLFNQKSIRLTTGLRSANSLRDTYKQWKSDFNIKIDAAEDEYRFGVFSKSFALITESNKQNNTYTLGLTPFTHLTQDEFASIYLGFKASKRTTPRNVSTLSTENLPSYVNWTHYLNPVKNQGQCGSCWAFSSVGGVEAIWSIQRGQLRNLSEQQLVSCATAAYGGNAGCAGGDMDEAFRYIIENQGVTTEKEFPYTATNGTCKTKGLSKNDPITSFTDVTVNSSQALKAAIAQQPVTVAIQGNTTVFQHYTGGVLTGPACGLNLDHGVIAVGYDETADIPYYLVRNSWGPKWGIEKGYVKLAINSEAGDPGVCGIHMSPSFPSI